ncbi:MAG TPA: glycerophosphodiester phosphodiesterase [Candidatus Dormibacteraeota bacterium]|nr:glycerophosphodiester phosphodiesterase [Candidatus Dormibacteraeota bacterium]
MIGAVRWIGHAGLALDRPAGAPDVERLDRALRLGLDRLEVDVAVCASGELVLVHDTVLPAGAVVELATLAALRCHVPGLLTLDEALEHLGGRMPLLLDVKGASAQPLGDSLRTRGDVDALAVCTDDLMSLVVLRHRAPRVARWRTLPATGVGRGSGRRRIVAAALRSTIPSRLGPLAAEVAAVAVCVDRWAVTSALCRRAHGLGLLVDAWTVNDVRTLRRVAECGVDLVTTDLPEALAGRA